MKKLNLETAIKRYNSIMQSIGYDHLTIGTSLSEDTDGWNIRDMVAECDYVLGTYFEDGHCNAEIRYSDDADDRKAWWSETGKLKRFIEAYKPFIDGIKCVSGHCSRFDK